VSLVANPCHLASSSDSPCALSPSVISYYNEDLETIRNTIEQVKKRLPGQTTSRTIVYAKGPNSASRAAMSEFLQKIDADEIVALKNVGREGETYLVRP
jgi:hypothetical protein